MANNFHDAKLLSSEKKFLQNLKNQFIDLHYIISTTTYHTEEIQIALGLLESVADSCLLATRKNLDNLNLDKLINN